MVTLSELEKFRQFTDIIVVDNGSNNDIMSITRNKFPWVNLKCLNSNIGIAAYNIGAEMARTPYLVFLDDDSTLSNNSIHYVETIMTNNVDIGIIAFEIVLPSNNTVVTRDLNPGPIAEFWGCGFAIRKNVWDQLGGYDKHFFLYVNEHDLAIRCWDLGYKVVYDPRIKAYHRVSSMNRTSGRLVEYSVKNNLSLIFKNLPRNYWYRCIVPMLFTWFVRALLTWQVNNWFKGVMRGFKDINHYYNYRKVNAKVVKFYINNYKLYEWPIEKLFRKIKVDGLKWFSINYR